MRLASKAVERGRFFHGVSMSRLHPLLQALWNLRMLALFLLGPLFGLALVGGVFGLPSALYLPAGGMFLFSLGMMLILVVSESRRIDTARRR